MWYRKREMMASRLCLCLFSIAMQRPEPKTSNKSQPGLMPHPSTLKEAHSVWGGQHGSRLRFCKF